MLREEKGWLRSIRKAIKNTGQNNFGEGNKHFLLTILSKSVLLEFNKVLLNSFLLAQQDLK
jgi:hypothetical protein